MTGTIQALRKSVKRRLYKSLTGVGFSIITSISHRTKLCSLCHIVRQKELLKSDKMFNSMSHAFLAI